MVEVFADAGEEVGARGAGEGGRSRKGVGAVVLGHRWWSLAGWGGGSGGCRSARKTRRDCGWGEEEFSWRRVHFFFFVLVDGRLR